MNLLTRTLLDGLLAENPVFMSFIGATLAVVVPRSAKSSLLPAVRFAVVFTAVGLAGAEIAGAVPDAVHPLVFLTIAAAGVAVLIAWGELRGSWFGLPQPLLALAPLFGFQVALAGAEVAVILAGAVGRGLGFAVGFIVIGSIREYSKISEASALYKTNPVVLFSMAIFALALTGFRLL